VDNNIVPTTTNPAPTQNFDPLSVSRRTAFPMNELLI